MDRKVVGLLLLMIVGFVLIVIGISSGSGIREIKPTGNTLEGKVTYGSEPVLVGMIIVAPETGDGAQGFIGEDGRYVVENAPLGEVKVAVNVDAGRAQLMSKMMSGQKVPKITPLPKKYGEPGTAGIKTTINKGANTYDIVIPR